MCGTTGSTGELENGVHGRHGDGIDISAGACVSFLPIRFIRFFLNVVLSLVLGVFANVLDYVGHGIVHADRGVHRPRCSLDEKDLERWHWGRRNLKLLGGIVILLL